jgi:hypothetical protein
MGGMEFFGVQTSEKSKKKASNMLSRKLERLLKYLHFLPSLVNVARIKSSLQ